MKRGRMIYVPPVIIDEVLDIQREDAIEERPQAFKKLVEYARVGREVHRIKNLDFSTATRLPSIDTYTDIPKGFKYWKKRGVV